MLTENITRHKATRYAIEVNSEGRSLVKMHRWIGRVVVLTTLGVVAFLPGTALALNDTCANAHARPMGYQFTFTGSGIDRYYRFLAVSGASYHINTAPVGTNDGATEFCDAFVYADSTCTAEIAVAGDEDTQDWNGDGDGFVATATQAHTALISHSAEATAFACATIIQETTLFSPWFFREPANGYDGFVEIRNNDSFPAGGIVVTAFNSNGVAAGSTTISIPANGTALVQVSTLGAAGFGSVRIATPQKPGTIVANITTLSGVTGLSFDAPFTRRVSPYQ